VAFLLRSIAAVALVAVAATPLPAVGAPASPAQVDVSSGSVVEAITKLKPAASCSSAVSARGRLISTFLD
jgi:hypothetical protein